MIASIYTRLRHVGKSCVHHGLHGLITQVDVGVGIAARGMYVVPAFDGNCMPPLLAPPSFSCVRP